ncbi:MAG: hypothetical protein QOH26_1175 [Actinomycetota bacterium]|jgi:hypothetical protein|nr:hypothetical protein [Actinomycetota bacterium]
MITARILRCNPLTHHRHHDPVSRAKRHRLRPNSAQTLFALLAATGLVMVMASAAFGQSLSGGCGGAVNGSPPSALTEDHPLVVGKGENITIQGTAPGGQATGGSVTGVYTISIIEGLFKIDRRNENWTANGKQFRGSVNVDNYLKFGSGLYKVEGVVKPASGGWSCTASFYMRLDGSKIVGYVGGGIGALGAAGTLRAGRTKGGMKAYEPPPETGDEPSARAGGETAEGISKGFGKDFVGLTEEEMASKPKTRKGTIPDPLATRGADAGWACLALILGMLILPSVMLLIPTGMASDGGSGKRYWVKGRPVMGFFSGLIGGLGATLALQQFGYWPLTMMSAVVFPLSIAVLSALRGWRGTAFKTS